MSIPQFPLFFVMYLVYLHYTNLIKSTNKLFNLHFYVLVLYISTFITFAWLTFSVYALEATGAALGEVFKFMILDPSMQKNPCFITEVDPLTGEKSSTLVEGKFVSERSGKEEVHTPSERKSEERWGGLKSPADRLKRYAGQTVFNKFVQSTDELSANNQKIIKKSRTVYYSRAH